MFINLENFRCLQDFYELIHEEMDLTNSVDNPQYYDFHRDHFMELKVGDHRWLWELLYDDEFGRPLDVVEDERSNVALFLFKLTDAGTDGAIIFVRTIIQLLCPHIAPEIPMHPRVEVVDG